MASAMLAGVVVPLQYLGRQLTVVVVGQADALGFRDRFHLEFACRLDDVPVDSCEALVRFV